MLAFGDLAADGLAVIDLAAIGAEIEPAGVGILGDDAAGGADEARFVGFVMPRHREFQDVDGVAFDDVLEYRAVVDKARRQRFELAHARVVALHDIGLARVVERQSERERDALDRRQLPVERAKTFWIAGHVVEQDRRRQPAAFFGEHMGDRAHLDVPMGAGDALKLAECVDRFQPAAQAAIILALCRGGDRHAFTPSPEDRRRYECGF